MTHPTPDSPLARVRAAHTRGQHRTANQCACCLSAWPCVTAQLADDYERLQREHAAMVEHNELLSACHVTDVDEIAQLRARLEAAERELAIARARIPSSHRHACTTEEP